MKSRFHPVAIAFLFAGIPAALCAQWPDHPLSKTPRTPDGKPKLDAPAPRTPDGKPDLSGVWEYAGRIGLPRNSIPGVPPEPPPERPKNGPPAATFFDIGAGIKGGLPLTPWAAQVLKQRKGENSKNNPDAHCLPLGLMQLHTHPQPRKIIQTPGVIVILYEAQAGIRQIFTDGRTSPPDDVQPWWYGYSVGHWEGDTLVVDVTDFTDATWFDRAGNFHSDALKVTERYTPMGRDVIRYEATIEDPQVFTRPWKISMPLYRRLEPNAQLTDFRCVEMVEETMYGHLRKDQLVKHWEGTTMNVDITRKIPPGEAVHERYISGNPPAK